MSQNLLFKNYFWPFPIKRALFICCGVFLLLLVIAIVATSFSPPTNDHQNTPGLLIIIGLSLMATLPLILILFLLFQPTNLYQEVNAVLAKNGGMARVAPLVGQTRVFKAFNYVLSIFAAFSFYIFSKPYLDHLFSVDYYTEGLFGCCYVLVSALVFLFVYLFSARNREMNKIRALINKHDPEMWKMIKSQKNIIVSAEAEEASVESPAQTAEATVRIERLSGIDGKYKVHINEQEVGHFNNLEEAKAGASYELENGSLIEVKFKEHPIFGKNAGVFEIKRDGRTIDGTEIDEKKALNVGYFLAGLVGYAGVIFLSIGLAVAYSLNSTLMLVLTVAVLIAFTITLVKKWKYVFLLVLGILGISARYSYHLIFEIESGIHLFRAIWIMGITYGAASAALWKAWNMTKKQSSENTEITWLKDEDRPE